MAAGNDNLIEFILRFGDDFRAYSPEKLIYGFSCVSTMDDDSIRQFLSEDTLDEIHRIRTFFSDRKLDPELIKIGLLIIYPFLSLDKTDRQVYRIFEFNLSKHPSSIPPVKWLEASFEACPIPFQTVFREGNKLVDVIDYIYTLKAVRESETDEPVDTETAYDTALTDDAEAEDETETNDAETDDDVKTADDTEATGDFDESILDNIEEAIREKISDPYANEREIDLIRILIEYLLDSHSPGDWTWENVITLLNTSLTLDNYIDKLFDMRQEENPSAEYIKEYENIRELDKKYVRTFTERAVRMLTRNALPDENADNDSGSLTPLECECRRFLKKWDVDRIIAYLDEHMVSQKEAKEKIAELCYEHIYRIAHPELNLKKSSYVMFGPTGSGKTEIIRQIRNILPVPVELIDASLITSEGFKGENISAVMRSVMNSSSWMDRGIIVFDEFDKICFPRYEHNGGNVNKEIQGQFLKIIEGESYAFNTEKVTFICCGAFDGAFSDYGKTDKKQFQSNINKGISQCLIDYGMIPEIAGRINTIIPFEKLGIEDYKEILMKDKDSINAIRMYYKNAYGIDIELSEKVIDRLCVLAAVSNLGARGIESVIRIVFSYYRKEAKDRTIKLTPEMIDKAYLGITSNKEKYSRNNGRNIVLIQQKNDLTLNSVAGLEEEKEELREIIDFLRNPEKYSAAGARLPKGVLLIGPPGTGKTMLAKAIAGEAQVPFYSLSGSDFIGKYVYEGVEKVKELFRQAKSNAPAILFIDEIDAIAGSRRGNGNNGILNQILVEMDGFFSNSGLIVLAATNLGDSIDPALKRAGRFDRKVYIRKPDVAEREAILRIHASNKRLSKKVDLHETAVLTIGFSGAELESLLNEAAIDSIKAGRKCISKEDIHDEFIRMCFGTEKKHRQIPEKEKRSTAYHESGHALALYLLPHMADPQIISIIPTGNAAGYVYHTDEEGSAAGTKDYMLERIKVALAGRIAEEMYSGDITAGAYSDIKNATALAKEMVTVYGMSRELGPVSFEKGYSEATGKWIDDEISGIINGCYGDAKELLESHKDILEACVELLMEKERITGAELRALFRKKRTER